jgi:hypothetical protein
MPLAPPVVRTTCFAWCFHRAAATPRAGTRLGPIGTNGANAMLRMFDAQFSGLAIS